MQRMKRLGERGSQGGSAGNHLQSPPQLAQLLAHEWEGGRCHGTLQPPWKKEEEEEEEGQEREGDEAEEKGMKGPHRRQRRRGRRLHEDAESGEEGSQGGSAGDPPPSSPPAAEILEREGGRCHGAPTPP